MTDEASSQLMTDEASVIKESMCVCMCVCMYVYACYFVQNFVDDLVNFSLPQSASPTSNFASYRACLHMTRLMSLILE